MSASTTARAEDARTRNHHNRPSRRHPHRMPGRGSLRHKHRPHITTKRRRPRRSDPLVTSGSSEHRLDSVNWRRSPMRAPSVGGAKDAATRKVIASIPSRDDLGKGSEAFVQHPRDETQAARRSPAPAGIHFSDCCFTAAARFATASTIRSVWICWSATSRASQNRKRRATE